MSQRKTKIVCHRKKSSPGSCSQTTGTHIGKRRWQQSPRVSVKQGSPWFSSFLLLCVCVCMQAPKKSPVGLNTLCCFLFFSGWVPDGHVTPEHMYSGQTSGTAPPTESILWSPGGAEKSCTCSSLLHGEGNLSVTCHRSSKLISAAETLLTSTCANGEWHGWNYKRGCSKSGKGLRSFWVQTRLDSMLSLGTRPEIHS